ncbi:hypothetical protein BAE44_0015158 [Dichanthelium oligosanthes]|uniref:Disease resistance R13L4/SHOC-2-like LRR domain-containing protein n=1 Tax=Dichanthelium oligosanthes TaxID=888268 RepID=A0A1E5VFB3_9POAL|nr:hypothetical protein BAE44_0015158 [Dichanthelium oligosanthes]
MILELICSLSREESFVTTSLDDIRQSKPYPGSKVRRLSLHNATWPSMEMSKLRSLTIFSSTTVNSMTSQLSCCHLLRVLDLQGCNLQDHPSLRFLGNLFHLRYLSLARTGYAGELPPVEIGKLQFLQTLDISGTDIEELPLSIVGLKQLMRLLVESSTRLPNRLRNLTSLEDLWGARVDSACTAEELGHLMQLRILRVDLRSDNEGRWDERVCKALVASLGKLHRIQSLAVMTWDDVVPDLEGSVESLSNLSFLYISKTKFLPTWISPASLVLLSYLEIMVVQVRRKDIQVLGKLQALRYLRVYVRVSDDKQVLKRFMVSPDAFPCVIKCTFYGFTTVPSMFPPGAMPRLEEFRFCIQLEDFSGGEFTADDLALGHLPSLQSVRVDLFGKRNVSQEVGRQVEEKLWHEADIHPNHPKLWH